MSELSQRASQSTHHEQSVVCSRGNDSDLDPVFWVPTGVTIEDVDVLSGVQVVDGSFSVDLKGVLAGCVVSFALVRCEQAHSLHLDVDRTPPDIVFTSIFVHDSLVFGRSTGLLSREVDQGSAR